MQKAVFWDVPPCGSCKNRSVPHLQVTANAVSTSLIIFIYICVYVASTVVLPGIAMRGFRLIMSAQV
jgi:hypothetical protein